METDVCGLADVWFLLCGSISLSALGWTSVDVSMKNMSNRNMMSVIEDMLKAELTLLLLLRAISANL